MWINITTFPQMRNFNPFLQIDTLSRNNLNVRLFRSCTNITIDIQLILRAKMEWKELQNSKQQIQIIICNDHNDTAQWWNGDRVRSRKRNKNGENVLVLYVSSVLLTRASRSSLEACNEWGACLIPHVPSYWWRIFALW